MKENETWISIVTALKGASEAGTWAFWRERFQCTHPDHNPEEVDNPAQFAYANWHAAKHVYLIHKEEMDKYANEMKDGTLLSYPGKTQDCEMFFAMKRVVEEEVEQEFEEQILKEEIMKPDPNLDEDEQYVAETEGHWDGDDFLADEELEDEDHPLDEEEYVDDSYLDEEY